MINEMRVLGASHSSVHMCLILRKKPSHPEVCYLWDPLLIEEDVASLDIPVDDAVMRILMQV